MTSKSCLSRSFEKESSISPTRRTHAWLKHEVTLSKACILRDTISTGGYIASRPHIKVGVHEHVSLSLREKNKHNIEST